jgi:small-conductance mechanosensitive channel
LVEAERDNVSITVKYQDNLKNTRWAMLTIRLTNGTVVYTSNVTGLNLIQWVYLIHDNTLGYWVEVKIEHGSMSPLSYTKALPPPLGGKTSPWDLSPLGSFPIPANQVFGVFIVLVFAGLFSTLNAEYGIVLVCMVAGILWLIGWLNISAAILAFAMSLAVLYALGRRNIQT